MKARHLIETATFEPATLRVIFEAFDDAWSEIAPHFDGDEQIEQARTRLAHAVLMVADEDSRDTERLKTEALQVMAMAYREPVGLSERKDEAATG